MEIILTIAVIALFVTVLRLSARVKTLEGKHEALRLQERDDFADVCNAFEEQCLYVDKLHAEWVESKTAQSDDESDEKLAQKAAERQAALYTQGINNILGYGGGMGE